MPFGRPAVETLPPARFQSPMLPMRNPVSFIEPRLPSPREAEEELGVGVTVRDWARNLRGKRALGGRLGQT